MINVFFIKVNGLFVECLVSVVLYEIFLMEYKKFYLDDNVIEFDLFEVDLFYYDVIMMSGLYKEVVGEILSLEEKCLVDIVNSYLD